MAADEPMDGFTGGPVAEATFRRLVELGEARSALGQVALALAHRLDGAWGMGAAAVAKELRATLKELTPDDGGDAFAQLMSQLSPPVRNASPS